MNKRIFSILPLIVLLSACGYDLREVYPGDAYNNPIFEKNYYSLYSSQIDKSNPNNTLIGEPDVYYPDDYLTSYEELEQSGLDPYVYDTDDNHGFVYEEDIKGVNDIIADFSSPTLKQDAHKYGYGPSYKMNRVDDIFSYGYLSKLYDGQLFCHSLYQLSRVQVAEEGFGVIYNKEMVNNSKYMAFNFKGILYKPSTQIGLHMSNVQLEISLYSRSASNFKETKFVIDLDVACNSEQYTFLVIPIEQYNLTRIAGYSFAFKFKSDSILDTVTDKENYQYALMLYEVFFPNSSWR